MLGFLFTEFRVSVAGLGAERETLRGSASGGISDCEHGDDSANDNRNGASATSTNERVALFVVRLHGHGRHDEVGAVDGDHGRLSKAGFRVVFLDGGVHGDEGDDEEDEEIDLVAVSEGQA